MLKGLYSSVYRDWLIIAVIVALVSLPLFVGGLPFGLDFPHHFRMALGFYESAANGNFPPSWLAITNDGYGDPSVRFYPPVLYYLLLAYRLLVGDWYSAALLTFVSLNATGCFSVWLWAREFLNERAALIAALIYPFTVFHANELYQAGMYAQYAAASVLPLVFAFYERILRNNRNNWFNTTALAASYALLVLTNLPLAVLGTIALAVYALLTLPAKFDFKRAAHYVLAAVLAAGLSCFYWLPLISETKWKNPSGVKQAEWFDYRRNFLFTQTPSEEANYLLPIMFGVTVFLSAPALSLLFRRQHSTNALVALTIITVFLSTSLSQPVWDVLPFLQETQFPWRWLTITSLLITVLTTIGLTRISPFWSEKRKRPIAMVLTGLVAIAISFTVSQTIRNAVFLDRQEFEAKLTTLPRSTTNQDFLPIWAKTPRSMWSLVESNGREVEILDWSPERKLFKLGSGTSDKVRLKLFYYPYWIARAAGLKLNTVPDKDGALLIDVPAEEKIIEVAFTEPFNSQFAAVISICSWLTTLGFIFKSLVDRWIFNR